MYVTYHTAFNNASGAVIRNSAYWVFFKYDFFCRIYRIISEKTCKFGTILTTILNREVSHDIMGMFDVHKRYLFVDVRNIS